MNLLLIQTVCLLLLKIIGNTSGKHWKILLKFGAMLLKLQEYIRNLVLLTVYNGGRIRDIELKDGYDYLIETENQNFITNTSKDLSCNNCYKIIYK